MKKLQEVRAEIKKVIVGQDELIDYALIGIISGGHILLEGVPGLAKTLMVKTISKVLDLDFKRIQFTPDLMPADLTGTKIFDMQKREFMLRKGPVFTQMLLADELNRTPPKTQAGLLEAMAEGAVTLEGEHIELDQPYVVFATQNPLEYEGTYALPEALVDRFMMKVYIDYPDFHDEKQILMRHNQGFKEKQLEDGLVNVVCTKEDVLNYRERVNNIQIDEDLVSYILQIVRETREDECVEIGSSPRGGIALVKASKGWAFLNERDFVIPEDIKQMAIPTLRHRLILKPEVELEGMSTEEVLEGILSRVKVPR